MKNLKLNIISDTFYNNPAALNFVEILEKYDDSLSGAVLYYEYPILREIDEELYYPTFMLVSPKYGINLFLADSISTVRDNEIEALEERILRIEQIIYAKLLRSGSKEIIKKRRGLKFNLSSALFLPNLNETVQHTDTETNLVLNNNELLEYLEESMMDDLNEKSMKEIFSILDSSSGIIKPKERIIQEDDGPLSKAALLKLLEEEISVFDSQQQYAALSQLKGPQRIRGLAGSGKTIILCMKAAILHLRYPDKKILYTFMTKSLYSNIEVLITRFYKMLGDGYLPDFKNNIHIRHSWGSESLNGVYYQVCKNNNLMPVPFQTAITKAGRGSAFDYVCKDLLATRNGKLNKEYDYVLIDEGQDFLPSFYQVCREIVRNDCLVWAYDDLQNIFNVKIQDTINTFKNEYGAEGISLSELHRKFPHMDNDIVLHKCYRNPKEILVSAHALGFGIYHDTLLQTLENKEHWKDVGYEVVSDSIEEGKEVIIKRPDENSPLSVSKYNDVDEIIQHYSANDFKDEINWVVQEVKAAIEEDGLRPDDIIIISLDDYYSKSYFEHISNNLYNEGIYTNNLSSNYYYKGFMEDGKVTLSTVYKAKGHESAMVFVIGCDVFEKNKNLLNMRNRVFTAFTRAKAWLRISGVNISEDSIIKELNDVKENDYQLKFIHKTAYIIKRDLQANIRQAEMRGKLLELHNSFKKKGYTDKEIREVLKELGNGSEEENE